MVSADYMREYRKNNRPYLAYMYRQYMINNCKKFNTKIECECGATFLYHSKSNHLRTKKHLKYISNRTE